MKGVANDLCLTGGESGVVTIERDETLNELALFAGAGGGILGGLLCGFKTVCAVEIEPSRRNILMQRQDDGLIEPFPIWDDVQSFDGNAWRGVVDIVTGGFPCQDISVGGCGDGLDGERSGLWKEFARIICEVRPRYVLVENSPALTVRGLYRVLADLASMGFNAEWGVLGAIHAGAPHERERMWIVANSTQVAGTKRLGGKPYRQSKVWGNNTRELSQGYFNVRLETEPLLSRMADGMANRLDRLAAIGDGQVPAVVALAWNVLRERLK
jgi:DNA (cytosine-5)-methyltransferase 1